METTFKKFKKLTENAKNILIITPPNPNIDILTSSFALYHILKKSEKEVAIFNNQYSNLKNLDFLDQPKENTFLDSLDGSRDFLLIFNTKYNKIINIATEENKEEVIIRLTPEKGTIDPRDFSLTPADFKYDLAIIIGAPTLEHLGDLYQKNTDLFFEIPKININNSSDNDDYGQINIVDLTAPSLSEIISELIEQIQPEYLNQEIAKTLLTGIISATEGFQKPTVTPQTLLIAAKLIKLKADQSEIIKNLYRTKPLSFLKLWGRTMARLNWDNSKKFIWSLLSTEDFLKSRAENTIIPKILYELRKNYTKGQIFGIIYSQDEDSYGQFFIKNNRTLNALAEEYNTKPEENILKLKFKNKDLLKAEKDFQIALNKNV